ncbi:MAG: chemotaxis-specific protein-glutamate methyltransferase CheB [Candidatus Omnitrophica bacterium]|nr:chemotaxis-specific protein-glutamate methyltransferase CheB [Candidatus Omnitrophota bacterium]
MEKEVKKIVQVLIAEDSPVIARVIENLLSSDPQIRVVGKARNGQEAVELTAQLKPDIITMDIHMPVMDGYEATKQIMAHTPTPILIASAAVQADGIERMFRAVSYGALDLIDISEIATGENKALSQKFIDSVKLLSRIKVVHHLLAKMEDRNAGMKSPPPEIVRPKAAGLGRILAIVASTGGPMAILMVLKMLPTNFPTGIVIVQHITSGFLEQFAHWLRSECQLQIRIAQNNEEILPGVVYLAPCDLQMRVGEGGIIKISDEPLYEGHKPSGTLLLDSVAKVYKEQAVGVILTGMGKDGAKGMREIKLRGGKTIAQDEASCIVFGMPKEAISLGVIDRVCPMNEIANDIMDIFNKGV